MSSEHRLHLRMFRRNGVRAGLPSQVFLTGWFLLLFAGAVHGETVPTEDEAAAAEILQNVQSIRENPVEIERAEPWLAEEQGRIEKEIAEIDGLLSQLLKELENAESSREGLARAYAREMTTGSVRLASSSGRPIDFTRDIRPILSNHCVACHGPDEKTRKAGLRLDLLEEAVGADRAIRPGDSKASPLFHRITTEDPSDRMPPAKSGKELNPDQIALLKRWIDEGAHFEGHWAFSKPVRPPLPEVSKPDWVRNGIDSLVLSDLDEKGIAPSEEADKHTLVRRLFLDLTGLPPTPTEADQFLQDDSPDAYEKLVDRLLGSPHFGERWAKVWLDIARYADTQGYEKDNQRTIWRYRDWVIDALNRDLPFDQFTIEQLAGDLLENPSEDQILATAFHRNTMTNTEGGTDDEEFRTAAIVDRVNTTMEAWMGMTMACAQCHTHKYDPITLDEYYRFFAFFNQTEDNDQPNEEPTVLSPTEDQKVRLDALERQIELSRNLLQSTEDSLSLTQREWEEMAKNELAPLPRLGVWRSVGPFREADYDIARGGAFEAPFAPEQGVNFDQTFRSGSIAWTVQPDWSDGAPHTLAGDFSATYIHRTIESATHQALEVEMGSAGSLKVFLNGQMVHAFDGERDNSAKDRISLPLVQGTNHLLLKLTRKEGENQFAFRPLSQSIAEEAWRALNLVDEVRTQRQRDAVRVLHRSVSPDIQRVETLLSGLQVQREELVKTIPTTPVFRELPNDRRRETHVLLRGNFLDKGDKVGPGVPSAFHSYPEGAPETRLGLAQWLTHRDNPLTARVVVNRYWSKFFGRGLVETPEDFGTQGEPPSNPELLDWLAVELMDQGWSLKSLCRTIVTSSVYRQSSKHRPDLEEIDPNNRFLARGPRFRLDAEVVRDQALRASGLLSAKMHGPSVMPPQPEGVWQVVYSGDQWETSKGEDRYRRGLYTFWRRTSPYPSMVAFDAPSREICTSLRINTNTPLQALVTLNDPVYVEAAQALARRAVGEGETPLDRLTYAFRAVLVRPPTEKEAARLLELFDSEKKRFEEDRESALALATDPLGPLDDPAKAPELAAWTTVANVLFNLDETVSRL